MPEIQHTILEGVMGMRNLLVIPQAMPKGFPSFLDKINHLIKNIIAEWKRLQ
jgi:hypothetical protein